MLGKPEGVMSLVAILKECPNAELTMALIDSQGLARGDASKEAVVAQCALNKFLKGLGNEAD